MHVHHLTSVDGEIVFDVDPDVVGPFSVGVRLADGLTVDDGATLARLRTTMHAAFEIRRGGASVGVRPRLLQARSDTIAALVEELREFADETSRIEMVADFGIAEAELSASRIGLGERAAGVAVTAAAEAWLGTLERVAVAVEGFGATGESVAAEMVRRGARVVAVSTERGAIADAAGFDVAELVAARAEHGNEFVHRLDRAVHLPRELHELPVDVLVPGPAFGILAGDVGAAVQAKVVAPSGLGPYTDPGRATLRDRRVVTLPDTVTAAGSMLAAHAPIGLSDDEILGRVDRLVAERIEAARLAKIDPVDYIGTLADTFAATWLSR